jgi:hypothetical protein
MLRLTDRLEHNQTEVAAAVIDGEAIYINLSNGTYYSADKIGAVICTFIEKKLSVDEMIQEIVRCYNVSATQAQEDLEKLLQEMIQEKLILFSDSQNHAGTYRIELSNGKMEYTAPKLFTYRDMGDLLALDPPMPGLTEIPWYGSKDKPSR